MNRGPAPELGGVNVWSVAAARDAELLGALGVELRAREIDHQQHFSARIGDVMVSLHPSERPRSELAFVVADLEASLAAVAAADPDVVSGPTQMPYGRSAHLVGPGGLHVELVELATKAKEG